MVTSRFVFLHWCSITVNIFLTNNGIFHQMLGVLSTSWIWCVGWRSTKKNLLTFVVPSPWNLKWHTRWVAFMFAWGSHPLYLSFFSMYVFLRWISNELECAECMPLIIISQYVKRMDPFCPKVDVMLDYRLMTRGSTSQSFDHSTYMFVYVQEDFGHNRSTSSYFQDQPVTCWHLLVFLCFVEEYFTNSYKEIRSR